MLTKEIFRNDLIINQIQKSNLTQKEYSNLLTNSIILPNSNAIKRDFVIPEFYENPDFDPYILKEINLNTKKTLAKVLFFNPTEEIFISKITESNNQINISVISINIKAQETKFYKNINFTTYTNLKNKHNSQLDFDKNLSILFIRYKNINETYIISQEIFETINNFYSDITECYVSPINSKSIKYFGYYPDIDRSFNSIQPNFQSSNLLNLLNFNPIKTKEITTLILSELKKPDTKTFILFIKSDYYNEYEKLSTSKFTVTELTLFEKEYSFSGIKPNFDATYLVVTNSSDKNKLHKIKDHEFIIKEKITK